MERGRKAMWCLWNKSFCDSDGRSAHHLTRAYPPRNCRSKLETRRETVETSQEDSRQPAQNAGERKARSGYSAASGNSGYVSNFHGQSAIGCDVLLGRGPALRYVSEFPL